MSEMPAAPHAEAAGAGLPRVFVGEGRTKLDAVVAKYPAKAGALLPALWMVQEAHGWISPAGMAEVAEALELTPAYVKGVVEAFLRATGAKAAGETSPDGRWTVVEVECLGACGFATPVMINDEFIEGVSAATVPALVARYR